MLAVLSGYSPSDGGAFSLDLSRPKPRHTAFLWFPEGAGCVVYPAAAVQAEIQVL